MSILPSRCMTPSSRRRPCRRADHGGGRRRLPPGNSSPRKLKKSAGQQYLDVRLVRTPDILATIDRPNLSKIGFAAETENLLENAAHKLAAKGLAMIVANDADSTIGAPTSTATILTADGVKSSSCRR